MSSFLGGSSGNEAIIEIRAKVDKLYSDISGMTTGLMSKLEGVEKQITDKLGKAGEKSHKTFFEKLFGGGTLDVVKGLGIATGIQSLTKTVVGGMSSAINSFMEFEFEMASVKAKSGATEAEFKKLEQAARDMGRTTYYNAIEAASGLKVLAEMGLTAHESIAALPKVLTLATTEGMNLADAADIALGSMRGMAMGVDQLDRIVDGLAYTAAKSASTVYSLGQGLKVTGAAAHLSGQSLEDVLSVLGGLANQMIRSETAGFAITQMMARLTRVASGLRGTIDETGSTVGQARETMRRLDVDLLSLTKTLRPLPEIFTDLKNKGAGTLEMLRVFGVYTYKYALAAINASETTNKLKRELTEVGGEAEGAGQRMAAIKLDTLKSDVKLASNALVELGITLGNIFSPVARGLVQAFTATIRELSDVIDGTKPLSVFEEVKPKTKPKYDDIYGGFDIRGIGYTEEHADLTKVKEIANKTASIFKQAMRKGWEGASDDWNFKIIDTKASDEAYQSIMKRFSIIKYNQFGLPIMNEQQPVVIPESDRLLEEELDKLKKAVDKMWDTTYAKQKVMSIDNLKHQLNNLQEQENEALDLINTRYDKEIEGLENAEAFRKKLNGENLAETLEITKLIIKAEFDRSKVLQQRRDITPDLKTEAYEKYYDSNNKRRIEEENKVKQQNARIAESFTRLSGGMKQNSEEYFIWKIKALDEQKGKELEIVKDTEEGKYLVEKWYNEQRKQLHYQEVERSKDLFGGAKVGFSKLADEGAMFGQIGEDWVYDLKSGFQSGFSTFFSDTLKGTKSWGESIKGLFTDIIGNILDSFAKAGSQLLANSLFNLLLGSLATKGVSTAMPSDYFTGSTAQYFNTGAGASMGTGFVKGAKGFKAGNKMSSNSDGITVHQAFNVTVTANDAQSVQQFFRRNGKIVQELAADGVNKSRRLKKVFRGNNE